MKYQEVYKMAVETPNKHNALILYDWMDSVANLKGVSKEIKHQIIYDLAHYATHGIKPEVDDPFIALFMEEKMRIIDKNNQKYDAKSNYGKVVGRPKMNIEEQVAELVRKGLGRGAIAETLGVSESTISRCKAWKDRNKVEEVKENDVSKFIF